MKKKAYVIEENLYTVIHNYLLTKPMNEVEAIVNGLRNCNGCEVDFEEIEKDNKQKNNKTEK